MQGRVLTVTTPEGNETETTYDPAGRVASETAPDGGVTAYAYDGAGRPLTTTDPTSAMTTNTYDTAGRLATVTRPGGAVTSYTYDANGQLLTTTEPGGAVTTNTYGVLDRLASVTDPEGRETTFTYDADGNQTVEADAGGGDTATTYDTAGRTTMVTDPEGRETTYTYDDEGRPETTTAPGGLTTTTTYDALGRVSTVTDPRGGVTTTTYTPAGRTATVTDPAALVIQHAYDNAGRLASVTVPVNRTTSYTYDGDGRQLSVTTPGGLVTTTTYDDMGRVLSEIDPAGVTTTRTWSLRGELLTETTEGQGTVTNVYDPAGTLASVTDAVGNTTSFDYDGRDNLTTRTNALSGVDEWTWDKTNRQLSHTDPLDRTTSFTYDPAGRLSTLTDPEGLVRTDTYNLDGTLASRSYLGGDSFTYSYDSAGRVSSIAGGSTYNIAYGYEPGGQRASSTTHWSNRTASYTYDTAGRRTGMRYPDGTGLAYTYNTAGQVSEIRRTEVFADSFVGSQLDYSKWQFDSPPNTYGYANYGELHLVADGAAGTRMRLVANTPTLTDSELTARWSFDDPADDAEARFLLRERLYGTGPFGSYQVVLEAGSATGRLVVVTGTTETTLATFAVEDDTTTQRLRFRVDGDTISVRTWTEGTTEPTTWSAQVTNTAHTGAGDATVSLTTTATNQASITVGDWRLVDLDNPQPLVASYTYDTDGHPLTETLVDGTRDWTWDDGQITGLDVDLPGLTQTTTRGYDTSGRVASDTVGATTTSYGYDTAGQLTSAAVGGGATNSWTYDDLGRRITETSAAGTVTSTYDAASQLTAQGSATFTYDDAGRRTTMTDGTTSVGYAYDGAGRLATLTRTTGTTTSTQTRTYGPGGLLFQTTTGSTTHTTDWDHTLPVAALLSIDTGGTPTDLIHGPGPAHTYLKAGKPHGAGIDINGSALPTTATASITLTSTYTPFGDTTSLAATPKLGYRGELTLDDLTYLRARDYQADTGQFTSRDLLMGVTGSPTLATSYHYSENDPLGKADPSGMRPTDVLFFSDSPPVVSLPQACPSNYVGPCIDQITFDASTEPRLVGTEFKYGKPSWATAVCPSTKSKWVCSNQRGSWGINLRYYFREQKVERVLDLQTATPNPLWIYLASEHEETQREVQRVVGTLGPKEEYAFMGAAEKFEAYFIVSTTRFTLNWGTRQSPDPSQPDWKLIFIPTTESTEKFLLASKRSRTDA